MIQRIDVSSEQVLGNRGAPDALFDANALFAQVATQAGIGAWSCNLVDDALSWTPGIYDLFGLSPAHRLDRRDVVALYEEESRAMMERLRAEAIAQARAFTMEAQIIRTDGKRRWMRLSADVVKDHGRVTRLFGLKQDITEEKMRWDALRRMAERDGLTGLSNRAVYEERFLNAPQAQPGLAPIAGLILIDLDNFKQINDQYGHAAGDACLRMAAHRIAAAFADAAMVARIGGDEFAVLPSSGVTTEELKRKVAQLLGDIGQPTIWRGHFLNFGASAGMAPASDPYRYDADELFSIADEALYAAKTAGRGTVITGRSAGQTLRNGAARIAPGVKLLQDPHSPGACMLPSA